MKTLRTIVAASLSIAAVSVAQADMMSMYDSPVPAPNSASSPVGTPAATSSLTQPPMQANPVMPAVNVAPVAIAPMPRRKPVTVNVSFVINLPDLNQGPMIATAGVIEINGASEIGAVASRRYDTIMDQDGNVMLNQVRGILFDLGDFQLIPGQENTIRVRYQVNGFSNKVDGMRNRTFRVMIIDDQDIRIEVDGVAAS